MNAITGAQSPNLPLIIWSLWCELSCFVNEAVPDIDVDDASLLGPAAVKVVEVGGIRASLWTRIPTIPARDSKLKAATIPIEGGQYWPVGMFMGSQRW